MPARTLLPSEQFISSSRDPHVCRTSGNAPGYKNAVAGALASLGGATLLVSGSSSPPAADALFVLLSLPLAATCAVIGIRLFLRPSTSWPMRLLVIANLLILLAGIMVLAYALWQAIVYIWLIIDGLMHLQL